MLRTARNTVASGLRLLASLPAPRPVVRVAKEVADRLSPEAPAAPVPTGKPLYAARKVRAERISPAALHRKLDTLSSFQLIDIREHVESRRGIIPGARILPVASMLTQLASLETRKLPIVLYCQTGSKSEYASQTLLDSELPVSILSGGMDAWLAASLPVVEPSVRIVDQG